MRKNEGDKALHTINAVNAVDNVDEMQHFFNCFGNERKREKKKRKKLENFQVSKREKNTKQVTKIEKRNLSYLNTKIELKLSYIQTKSREILKCQKKSNRLFLHSFLLVLLQDKKDQRSDGRENGLLFSIRCD